jgi:serine/threonine protein kinase
VTGVPATVGPYRVVRSLGVGGMGMVLAVQDPDVDRLLALKLIKSSVVTGEAVERFWREAEVLAKIRHRGVVRIHRIGQTHEGTYLLMELVEGANLREMCGRGPLKPTRAALIARDLAEAVSAVHDQGILHRDLKPGNVIVSPDGIPVLLDFGLAREADAETLTRTGVALGTVAYMSPEVGRGVRTRTLGAPTDVYGLGVILYEMLSGHRPFQGKALDVMRMIVQDDPLWPSEEGRDVPFALEAILQRAMAKAPDARYTTAEELRLDLDRFLEGTRPDALASSRSTPRIALVAIALLLLVLILIVAKAS